MAQIQVSDARGRKVWIPEHWMKHPVLSRGFKALPSTPTRSVAQAAADPGVGEKIPDESWTHDQLDTFAAEKGIDLTGTTTKAEKVSAMTSLGG